MPDHSIDQLFLQALELDGAKRVRFLASLGPELRERVEELLNADRSAKGANFLVREAMLDSRSVGNTDTKADALGNVEDKLPETIGRFQVLGRIGEGGMGSVVLAKDPVLNRQVAIKLTKFSSGNAKAARRFQREAQLAAALDHPNICPIYDFGDHKGQLYICMKYVEGQPLNEVI